MKKLLLLVALIGCDGPAQVLRHQNRPEPINCVYTGRDQHTCTDGVGVIWTCGKVAFGDAECIATGRVSSETP